MKQQIVISGIGGQGIVFLTRIITEVALIKDLRVFASETHGMAQRGGNVISHVKIYEKENEFWSPVISRGQADLMLCLHPSSLKPYIHLIRKDGKVVLNSQDRVTEIEKDIVVFDATGVAMKMGIPVMANLIFLGFVSARNLLFCTLQEIEKVLETGRNKELNLKALRMGASHGTY